MCWNDEFQELHEVEDRTCGETANKPASLGGRISLGWGEVGKAVGNEVR